MTAMTDIPTIEQLQRVAGEVCDPELPPLTLADLGILRSVEIDDQGVVVVQLTPTYSGCPAVAWIEDEVRRALNSAGCTKIRIDRVFSPAWTTDWITAEGRAKMTSAGIAPPRMLTPSIDADAQPGAANGESGATSGPIAVTIGRRVRTAVPCPRCGSTDTSEISLFGSTACKALHRCSACSEPFDHFKEI